MRLPIDFDSFSTSACYVFFISFHVVLLPWASCSSTKTWSQMVSERKTRSRRRKPEGPSRDYWDNITWTRPRWEKSPYFWVALTAWLTLVGVALIFQD